MAVDPMIARGVNPGEGIMGAIALAERIKGSREENELARLGMQMRQQEFGQRQQMLDQAQQQEASKREMQWLLPLIEQGNEEALKVAVERASKQQPQVGDLYRVDPAKTRDAIIQVMRQQLGVQPEKPDLRTVGDTLVQVGPDGAKPIYTAPQRPQAGAVGPAPTMTEVVDPADPTRMLRIDARIYRGGTLGAPGVFGVSGKEPTSAKRDEQRGTSRQAVDELVATLRDQFTQLNEEGGITNTDAGTLPNVSAGIRSSAPGQAVGRLAGTKSQSLRNQIAQTRPRLLSAVMAATGMSARQLDSNAELKLWLSAATDPTLDFQANIAALENIQKLYGTEGTLSGGQAPAGNAPIPGVTKEGGYIYVGGDPGDRKSWVKER